MFQWITVGLGITAVIMLGIAMDQVSEFNDRCTSQGSELSQCYSDRLDEMF
jgi:hypothetical protein